MALRHFYGLLWQKIVPLSDAAISIFVSGLLTIITSILSMKSKITLRNLAMTAALGVSAMAYAQPIVIEAENPIDTFECKPVSDMSAEGSEASGGAGLGSDNAHKGAYMQYVFEVPEAGVYDLSVWYVTMNTRWLSLQINNQLENIMACDVLTGNWNGVPGEKTNEDGEVVKLPGVACKTIPVYCEEGENFLMVRAIYGYSPEEDRFQPFTPNIDRFELVKSDVQMDKLRDWTEQDQIRRECEDVDAQSGDARVSGGREGFSGKAGASVGQSGGTLVYNIDAPEEGVYKLNIRYATWNRRWISVKVNDQVRSYVGFTQTTDSWGNDEGDFVGQRQTLVYLKKGMNAITFGQYTKTGKDSSEHGDSAPLDYFTLDLVNYPEMSEPEIEVCAYKAALSDMAEWTSTFDNSLFNDHNEHTVATASGNNATVTLEFPWNILVSGYSFATENNTDEWKVELSEDGDNWRDAGTPVSKSVSGRITTVILENPYADPAPVRYVRLTVDGNEPAALGEFNVFGNPYVSAENHNPEGLLPVDGTVDYVASHAGFDTGDWHEGIDKLFDGLNSSQYTIAESGDGGMGDATEVTVEIYLSDPVEVASYMLSTHYSPSYYGSRSPREWSLQVYDYDNDIWNVVDARNDMSFAVPASTLVMNVAEPMESDCIRLVLPNRAKQATHLSGFQMYAEPLFSGTETTVAAKVSAVAIAPAAGAVEISSTDVAAYEIHTVSGVAVARGTAVSGITTVKLPQGLYIVKAGGNVAKVAVK